MGIMNDFEESSESGAAKDIAIVLGSAVATTAALKGIAGYNNAVHPDRGVPRWKIGLDLGVTVAGLVGALVFEDTAALASLGTCIAGACSVTSDYATVGGAYVAHALGKAAPEPQMQSAPPPQTAVKGHGDEVAVGRSPMSDKQRNRYEKYVGR